MGFFKKFRWRYVLMFMAVIGPGIITANADNDGTGIVGYTLVGAKYGLNMLFALVVVTVILAVTQELGARIGVATGKGLGGVIREKFGLKLTMIALIAMLISNMGIIIADMGAIAEAMGLFGLSKYIVVPVFAILLWLVLYKGAFSRVEKVFLLSSALYVVYIITCFYAKPNWMPAIKALVTPSIQLDKDYINTLMVLIGTTVTIWGQFVIQSFVVDKGITAERYPYQKAEVFLGAFITDFVSFFIIVAAAATLFANHIPITTATQAAQALRPLAGEQAYILFALGLLNAGLLGVSVVTLSTAYAASEIFGVESKLDRKWNEAPAFYWIITLIIGISALLVLVPGMPLFQILIWSNNVNAVILPIILIYVYKIANDKKIMGTFKNGRVANIITMACIVLLIVASVFSLYANFS